MCAYPPCDANHQILKLTILQADTPRLGTGISTQRGGDGVRSDTWIYPVLYSYDGTSQMLCYVASSYCVIDPNVPFTYYTETTHWRTKAWAQLDAAGQWELFGKAASTTCDPEPADCTYLNYGGGA